MENYIMSEAHAAGEIYEKRTVVYAYDCPICGKHLEQLSRRQLEANVSSHDLTHKLGGKGHQK
jgi:hypothetical protein